MIAPDFRGHGDSSLAPDDFYDIAAYSIDCYTLVHDVLGHEHCAVAGGDVGGVVLYDLGLRYPGFVTHQVLFNTVPPPLDDGVRGRGPPARRRARAPGRRPTTSCARPTIPTVCSPSSTRPSAAQRVRRGDVRPPAVGHAERVHARRTSRSTPSRTPTRDKLRASWGVYEQTRGQAPDGGRPALFERTPVPTLVLYGPEDHVVLPSFPWKAAAACIDCTGPLFVPNAGHFLQWEAADTFNKITTAFCRG